MFRKLIVMLCLVGGLLSACGTPTDNTTAGRPSEATQANPPATSVAPTSSFSEVTAAPASGAGSKQYSAPPAMQIDPNKTYTAVIQTTKGDMTAELYAKQAPTTVNNFVFLAREGFYRNVVFHRVIKDFMAQTGDPMGTGMGGPGYEIQDEFDPTLRHDSRGILSMANAGANTGGSQFFITDVPTPHLDDRHAIFGKLTSGLETLDAIVNTPTSGQDRPAEEIRITDIVISEQ